MTQKPQDLAALKQAAKHHIRDVQERLANALSDAHPSLVAIIIRECWPSGDQVADNVAGKIQQAQQEADRD